MRIRGLGLRNCFRKFSGTCVPLSGRNGPPKNPATGNENLSLAKLSQIPAGTFFTIWAFRPAKIWHGFPCFVDCENLEEQLSNFWRTTKNESIVLFFFLLESCSFAPLIFSKYGGPLPLLHCQKPGRFAPGAFLKEETVASRTVLSLQRGWCCFWLGNVGLWFGDFWHVLSLYAVVGWSCWALLPTDSVGIRDSHGGSLSRLRFGRLWTCSFQPPSKVPPQ